VGLTAAALAVAYWVGDIPNRYRAAQLIRAGRVAQLSSDFPGALKAYRAAAFARPGDDSITREYDLIQTRWLEVVTRKIERLPPEDALRTLQSLPPTSDLLVEPHAGLFHERADAVANRARTAVPR
jgi:hypothetical protein